MKVHAELSSNMWKVLVAPGDLVVYGQELAILESMKMEIPVECPCDGRIISVHIAEGAAVDEGQLLFIIE